MVSTPGCVATMFSRYQTAARWATYCVTRISSSELHPSRGQLIKIGRLDDFHTGIVQLVRRNLSDTPVIGIDVDHIWLVRCRCGCLPCHHENATQQTRQFHQFQWILWIHIKT